MVLQYKDVLKRALVQKIFSSPLFKSQQLALPQEVIATVKSLNIYAKDFPRSSDYFFSSCIRAVTFTRYSILNETIDEYIPLGSVTLSIISQIEFSNNQFHFSRVLKR